MIFYGQTDGLGKMVLPNSCVPLGPGSAAPAVRGGPPRHAKIVFFFSARTDHYENIFEAFSLPARTFTKIFSKRYFLQANGFGRGGAHPQS